MVPWKKKKKKDHRRLWQRERATFEKKVGEGSFVRNCWGENIPPNEAGMCQRTRKNFNVRESSKIGATANPKGGGGAEIKEQSGGEGEPKKENPWPETRSVGEVRKTRTEEGPEGLKEAANLFPSQSARKRLSKKKKKNPALKENFIWDNLRDPKGKKRKKKEGNGATGGPGKVSFWGARKHFVGRRGNPG